MTVLPPLIGIAGWKNSGKTTLATWLIEEFSRRGFTVSSIKHTHHAIEIDHGDTDSARHRRAGASQVAIVSPARWGLVTELHGAPEPAFADVVSRLAPCDLVIVEGYKSQPIPKIEVRRTEAQEHRSLAESDPNVIAVAADHQVMGETVPTFDLDNIEALADFITTRLDLKRAATA